MAHFFINRPIFATVIALIISLCGIVAIYTLPVQQFPDVVPPTISINTALPGAAAETVENSVTQVIEQSLTGVDNLRFFSSSSDSASNVTVTLTFEQNTDPDFAQVQVQNKVEKIIPLLPQQVQQQGIVITKANSTILMVVGFYCDDDTLDQAALGDIVSSKIQDDIARLKGVGDVNLFGSAYAMRIWVNPYSLLNYNLTSNDLVNALSAQNIDVSAGQLGNQPSVNGQQLNATIIAASRLKTVDEFANIVVRVNTDGSIVYLRDVARIELGSQSYNTSSRYKGHPATGIRISLANGANALDTSELIKAKIDSFRSILPANIKIVYPLDSTPFIKLSIYEVCKTLVEAVLLVSLVMYLFLQNIRATLVPTIAVPIVLLGTFAILLSFGYSINTLTMFAMVLAIGLLVDDAIVVVENVERLMQEEGLSAHAATIKSMQQITSALIGITMVLAAVFLPMAFLKGSVGIIYRQFSITIVAALALSLIVALTITPALCANILVKTTKSQHNQTNIFFKWFNKQFLASQTAYLTGAKYMLNRSARCLAIYIMLIMILFILFSNLPKAFLPDEDQGLMYVIITTPPGSTAERTLNSLKQVEQYLLKVENDNIVDLFSVVGFSYIGQGQNTALCFIKLSDWSLRKSPDRSVFAISKRLMQNLSNLPDASVFVIYPPAITGLGNASGFDFQLVDRAGLGRETLLKARDTLLKTANMNPNLSGVRLNGLEDVAQYKLNIDNHKAMALGVAIADINNILQQVWSSIYVDDFIHEGRTKRVYLQADAPYRMLPQHLNDWYIRNNNNEMVSFASFSTGEWLYGSPKLERFNGISSINIQGNSAPHVSSGQAMTEMENIAGTLPKGLGYEWNGLSYEEKLSGSMSLVLYMAALLIVFLSLAALYESWSIPLAIILAAPLGMIGAVIAIKLKNYNNDIYFQIGLLTILGLTAKNAILIIEFAQEQYLCGSSLFEAIMLAAKQRYRPIMMTSITMMLGVVPLAIASGAGASGQNIIGLSIIGGITSATILVIFFVPVFYVTIQQLMSAKKPVKTVAKKL